MNDLDHLHSEWLHCQRCPLHAQREGGALLGREQEHSGKTKPGTVLVVGDPPSEEDIENGEYMTGALGDIFEEMLCAAGGIPHEVYIMPLLGCRPTYTVAETEDTDEEVIDRAPSKDELKACTPRLLSYIYEVDPDLIIALGDNAWKALVTPKDRGRGMTTIHRANAQMFVTHIPGVQRVVPYPVLALISPSGIAANPSTAAHAPMVTTAVALADAMQLFTWSRS